ncbi:hypothetical protein [Domibacillus iocasae]|uniref:Translation initiation factor 2 n=1 Tax=Domibacillus iocasae TaxID=1714016 RepID=A0A1E7DSV5_9BACI|nr:hypothetical protein [Domibacillus iocasae]OES46151.1 hypothetical protein BA724_16380 [Domibacillus iocasae]
MNRLPLNGMQKDNSLSSTESADVNAAKLAVLAGALTTFADAISTLAALISLDSLNNSNSQDQPDIGTLQKQMAAMQKEIAYLKNEARLNNSKY